MPSLDYSKWDALVKEVTEPEERGWGDFTQEEKRLAAEREDQEALKFAAAKREHEAYLKGIAEDAANLDDSWMSDVDQDSYEDFTIKRVWRVVKPKGSQYFSCGQYQNAEQQWLGALELIAKVGINWPSAKDLAVQLRSNISQLYIKQERWGEARRMATSAIDLEPKCAKALYRRALVHMHSADWREARRDLERILGIFPRNAEAAQKLLEVKRELVRESELIGGAGIRLSNAVEELTSDGALRKLQVLVPGQRQPKDFRWTYPWAMDEWLKDSREKAVLTAHAVVRTVGGEELFTTRMRVVLPETPEEQEELRRAMRQVAELDDMAGNQPRTPLDLCPTEQRSPMCWRFGDPAMYAGLDLAARSMMLGERALFEIDQPLLEPSVRDFYGADGGIAKVAGLPNFKHHIEERKLILLAEELPEWELDLENKTQRTVRVELELLSLDLFRDVSPERTGEMLVNIVSAGLSNGRHLRSGLKVLGDFSVAGALDGTPLHKAQGVLWEVGLEGRQSLPNRYGETIHVPRCVGQALQEAGWQFLREGARVELRLQVGPTPMQLNPVTAGQYDWKRAMSHKPPVTVTVDVSEIRSS